MPHTEITPEMPTQVETSDLEIETLTLGRDDAVLLPEGFRTYTTARSKDDHTYGVVATITPSSGNVPETVPAHMALVRPMGEGGEHNGRPEVRQLIGSDAAGMVVGEQVSEDDVGLYVTTRNAESPPAINNYGTAGRFRVEVPEAANAFTEKQMNRRHALNKAARILLATTMLVGARQATVQTYDHTQAYETGQAAAYVAEVAHDLAENTDTSPETYDEASARVGQVVDLWAQGETGQIHQLAEQFKAEHPEVLSDSEVDEYDQVIGGAHNKDELREVVDQFTEIRGDLVSIELDEDMSLAGQKQATRTTIEVLGQLPMLPERLELQFLDGKNYDKLYQGYTEGTGGIAFRGDGRTPAKVIVGSVNNYTLQHELSHIADKSIESREHRRVFGVWGAAVSIGRMAKGYAQTLLYSAIGKPRATSVYATFSDKEKYAEAGQHVIDGRMNSPQERWKFEAPVTADAIGTLIAYDVKSKGAAAYLVDRQVNGQDKRDD